MFKNHRVRVERTLEPYSKTWFCRLPIGSLFMPTSGGDVWIKRTNSKIASNAESYSDNCKRNHSFPDNTRVVYLGILRCDANEIPDGLIAVDEVYRLIRILRNKGELSDRDVSAIVNTFDEYLKQPSGKIPVTGDELWEKCAEHGSVDLDSYILDEKESSGWINRL